jgi:hypothetical protein
VHELAGPATIDDLVADAAAHGYETTTRLIRDWAALGLLDYPMRRGAGKGRGSKAALYPENQRRLFLSLLHKRPNARIGALARIPVWLWVHYGDAYVPTAQAGRALGTWLDEARTSKQQARETARAVLRQLDHPDAAADDRRRLLDVVTEINYTGRADLPDLRRAVRAVFEPGSDEVIRAVGHPAAPLTVDVVMGVVAARLAIVARLTDHAVRDDELRRARQVYRVTYAQYAVQQPTLAHESSPAHRSMYAPVLLQESFDACCGGLLLVMGLASLNRQDAGQQRRGAAPPGGGSGPSSARSLR